MSTITLEQIQAEHARLGSMIATIQAAMLARVITVNGQDIQLGQDEHYAGMILKDDGTPDYHVILLAGEAEGVTWTDALKWAESAGGELPKRHEQALLFANAKQHFQAAWYWSQEQHASYTYYAWCQTFSYGYQYDYTKGAELRARAVRRLAIE